MEASIHEVGPSLFVTLDETPPPDAATTHFIIAADSLPQLDADSPNLSAAVSHLPSADEKPLLVLRPALALAAAWLIERARMPLLAIFECLSKCGCHSDLTSMPLATVSALVRLELSELGMASDLTALQDAPREWVYLKWRSAADSLAVISRGQLISVRRLRPEPRMAFVRGFLSESECAHIINLGKNGGEMHPSRVVRHDRKEGEAMGESSSARTSESGRVSAMQDSVVRRVVQRAAFLAGLTPAHAEAVQVVHYNETQQYRPHHDYFQPTDSRFKERCGVQGNRLVSFFAYLSNCAGGGKTVFPQLQVGFEPQVGCAAVWYNIDRHGNPDDRTLHAGAPVTSGEKWGLNVWLRERPRASAVKRGAKLVKAKLQLSGKCRDDAVDVADGTGEESTPIRIRLTLTTNAPPPPGVTPCPVCGDMRGPLGLCLCRQQYVF